jgi:hypothetical protein
MAFVGATHYILCFRALMCHADRFYGQLTVGCRVHVAGWLSPWLLSLVLLAVSAVAVRAAAEDGVEDQTQRIIAAVKLAYGLESEYWRNPSAYPTWKKLYAHYRKGFSASIAEEMTEFTLENDGDMATWIPEKVQVADYGADFALAWFTTPADFGEDGLWGFEPYMVVRLRREDDRWVIYWAADSSIPPSR